MKTLEQTAKELLEKNGTYNQKMNSFERLIESMMKNPAPTAQQTTLNKQQIEKLEQLMKTATWQQQYPQQLPVNPPIVTPAPTVDNVLSLFTDNEKETLQVLKQAVAEWYFPLASRLNSVNPMHELFIAGGVFSNLMHNTMDGTDVDFFLPCPDVATSVEYEKLIKTYCRNMGLNETAAGVNTALQYEQHDKRNIWSIVTTTPFKAVFGDNKRLRRDGTVSLQFILYNNIKRKDIVEGFDFLHSCVSCDGSHLFISKQSYDAMVSKTLRRNPASQKPPTSKRIQKFTNRGWKNETGYVVNAGP